MSALAASPVRSRRVTRVFMDTPVTIELVGCHADAITRIDRAFAWFEAVERTCSRFDPESELSRLSRSAGEAVTVSPMLFIALEFAVEMAELSGGAFDPALGRELAASGFNRNHRTGLRLPVPTQGGDLRDIVLDPETSTVRLRRPVPLDLGAIAKGLAIDLAGRELAGTPGFVVEAGGDILTGGSSPAGEPWRIGIRHPRDPEALLDTVALTGRAICTSGDYERTASRGHHLLDPRTGASATGCISVSVIAETAMLADALSTAAFVLGPVEGPRLLEREQVAGLVVHGDLQVLEVGDFGRYRP